MNTLVLVADPRTDEVAESYARAAGAQIQRVADSGAVANAVLEAQAHSITLFTLASAFTEELCFAVASANRARGARSSSPLAYGFMSALNVGELALVVDKTIAMLTAAPLGQFGYAEYDGATASAALRMYDHFGQVLAAPATERPWTTPDATVMSICTHGVTFDASLGADVLCGHRHLPPPFIESQPVPSCFQNNVCFRMNRGPGSPETRVLANELTPLVWFLNSCSSIAFAGCAFGTATNYVYGLLSGRAVAVIGSYLTNATSLWLNRLFEVLITTGATTGECTQAMAQLLGGDFDAFVLLGSPDVRLLPERVLRPQDSRYDVHLAAAHGARLALAESCDGTVTAVADDGGDAWADATGATIRRGRHRDLVVTFKHVRALDGWLRLGEAPDAARVLDVCRELRRRVAVLALYPFSKSLETDIADIDARLLRAMELVELPQLLRSRMYVSVLLAEILSAVTRVTTMAVDRFIEQVVTIDFTFDRESYNGFEPAAMSRTSERCAACASIVFEALDTRNGDRGYRRRRVVCPNCVGVALQIEDDPLMLRIDSVRADESAFALSLTATNHGKDALCVTLAVAPRHGPVALGLEPTPYEIPSQGSVRIELRLPPPPRARLMSYRMIAAAAGALSFYSITCVVPAKSEAHPASEWSSSGSHRDTETEHPPH